MSQTVVASLKAIYEYAHGLMAQFVEVCPEEIWAEKFGGWPVWQHVYHVLGAAQFMALPEGETPVPGLLPDEVGGLDKTSDKVPTKHDVLQFGARAKAKADAYINALQDTDLPSINRGLTARFKASTGQDWEFSNSQTLSMLAGHLFYHLGACDAALRQHGLKGVF